jgi:hypothetical protein
MSQSPPLRYLPAYFGLFATQSLALTCNAFLDIRFGVFGTEVLLWILAIAYTLRIGWKQQGEATEDGQRSMKRFMIFGGLVSVLIFIPMWGFPRAGLYILAMLMVAYNCSMTARRQLHFGLLMSLVMVMFAAAHTRADWTMLFYLIPYITAAVFTLVAEQINRSADDLREHSLVRKIVGAQSAAILAATSAILLLGLVLYALTPQVTWMNASWDRGLPTNAASVNKMPASQGNGNGSSGTGAELPGRNSGAEEDHDGFPTPAQMREVAQRPGMPEWQQSIILVMAGASEGTQQALAPPLEQLRDLWEALKKWLDEHRDTLLLLLILAGLLVLLLALLYLLKEAKAGLWLRTRVDFVRYGLFAWHAPDTRGTYQYYRAIERLFALYDLDRPRHANTREYLFLLGGMRSDLRPELLTMTRLFEDARYGSGMLAGNNVMQMRATYRALYTRIKL